MTDRLPSTPEACAEHHRKLERMYLAAPVNQFYLPTIAVEDGVAEIAIEARADFHHALGAVHGSVYFKLLDDAAFFAVASVLEDVYPLTASFNLYLTRPISTGRMLARGRVVQRSSRLFIAEAQVFGPDEKELARGSGNLHAQPGAPRGRGWIPVMGARRDDSGAGP